jgi:hypothetical protein
MTGGAASSGFPGTVVERYQTVRALALRLLRGEIIAFVDHGGRPWRASATQLVLVSRETGERVVVVDGDAYDVAERLSTLR